MSLDWSTQKVQYFTDNPDALWVKYHIGTPDEYEDVNAETKALIFGSMMLGFTQITEKNASEWYARWKMYEKYENHYLYSTYQDGEIDYVYLTPEIIAKHMNLSTNVSPKSTLEWCKHFIRTDRYSQNERPTLAEAKALITVFMMEYRETLSKEKTLAESIAQ